MKRCKPLYRSDVSIDWDSSEARGLWLDRPPHCLFVFTCVSLMNDSQVSSDLQWTTALGSPLDSCFKTAGSRNRCWACLCTLSELEQWDESERPQSVRWLLANTPTPWTLYKETPFIQISCDQGGAEQPKVQAVSHNQAGIRVHIWVLY